VDWAINASRGFLMSMPLVKVGDSRNLNENESGIHKGFFLTQKPRRGFCGL
jgi:hypothetical protein